MPPQQLWLQPAVEEQQMVTQASVKLQVALLLSRKENSRDKNTLGPAEPPQPEKQLAAGAVAGPEYL